MKAKDESFEQLLGTAFPRPSLESGELGVAGPSLLPQQDAFIGIVQKTQYALYVGFQLLVLALSAATTAALIVGIWRLVAHPDTAQAVLSAVVVLGSIVTGTAAVFVQKQATAAKKRWEVAANYRGVAP